MLRRVIVVNTPPGLAALQKATVNVPLVFVQVVDAAGGVRSDLSEHGEVEEIVKAGDIAGGVRDACDDVKSVAVLQNPEHPAWARPWAAVQPFATGLENPLRKEEGEKPSTLNQGWTDV